MNNGPTDAEEERVRATTIGQSGGPQGRPGLSNGHIRPVYNYHDQLNAEIIYYPEGQLVEVKTPWLNKHLKPNKEVKRGSIKYFSAKSRNRLRVRLSKVKKMEPPVFVTLTYPSEYPSMIDSKKDLKNFIKRMKRRYENIGYIWRLERQKRGAPHFHLFIWGASFLELLKEVPETWFEVVGSEDIKHLAAGTRVEKIRSGKGITAYVSKYLSKEDSEETEENIGRLWGYGGNIPFSDYVQMKITRRQAFQILRYLRRRINCSNESLRHYIVSYPEFWLENHERLTGDTVNF